MNIVVGLTDILSSAGSFKTSVDNVVRIAAPKVFTAKDITKLRRDCELLLDRVQKNPAKIQMIMKLGLSGDTQGIADLAKDLKLREEDFEKEGGGWIWVIVILAILLLSGDTKKK
jgi:hypothetical protein